MAYYSIPPRIALTGDQEKASQWIGFANEQVRMLFSQMGFQNLKQGSFSIEPHPGVTISGQIIFGQPSVVIHAEGKYVRHSALQSTKSYRYMVAVNTEGPEGQTVTPWNLSLDDNFHGFITFIAQFNHTEAPLSSEFISPITSSIYYLGEIRKANTNDQPLYIFNPGSSVYADHPGLQEAGSFSNSSELGYDSDLGLFYFTPPPGIASGTSKFNKSGIDLYVNPDTQEVAIWAFAIIGGTGYLLSQSPGSSFSDSIFDPSWFGATCNALVPRAINNISVPFAAITGPAIDDTAYHNLRDDQNNYSTGLTLSTTYPQYDSTQNLRSRATTLPVRSFSSSLCLESMCAFPEPLWNGNNTYYTSGSYTWTPKPLVSSVPVYRTAFHIPVDIHQRGGYMWYPGTNGAACDASTSSTSDVEGEIIFDEATLKVTVSFNGLNGCVGATEHASLEIRYFFSRMQLREVNGTLGVYRYSETTPLGLPYYPVNG